MKKPTVIFGWKNVFYNYGLEGFLWDSILPLTISMILCLIMYLNHSDGFIQVKHLVGVGLNVVPAMVALILAAYAILLTFLISDKFKKIKDTEHGNKLIKDLNSSFAACLSISSITLIAMIVTSCVANMDIEIANPDFVNYPVFAIICYLLVYSVSILIGIVIDIFNCGQTTLLDSES